MKEGTADVFDKVMDIPILNIFKPFYKKNKEMLVYLFFGGITFFLNIILYVFMTQKIEISILIANIISWVICVLFQFITNRIWVFDGRVNSTLEFIKQICSFFVGRIFTLIIEEMLLCIFVVWMNLDGMMIKLTAQIIVIILNYVISKHIIFKKL